MSEGPPLTIDRMQKLGEIYADPETGLTWIVYDPPLAGEILMEGFMDADIEVEEALELDEEGNLTYHTYDHPEGLVCRDGEWRSPDE